MIDMLKPLCFMMKVIGVNAVMLNHSDVFQKCNCVGSCCMKLFSQHVEDALVFVGLVSVPNKEHQPVAGLLVLSACCSKLKAMLALL